MNKKDNVAEYLIEKKVSYINEDIKFRDFSPLFLLVRENRYDLLEHMCDYDVDLEVTNSEGLTPIMYASKMGQDEVVLMLSLRSKNLNQEDSYSLTILMHYVGKQNKKMC